MPQGLLARETTTVPMSIHVHAQCLLLVAPCRIMKGRANHTTQARFLFCPSKRHWVYFRHLIHLSVGLLFFFLRGISVGLLQTVVVLQGPHVLLPTCTCLYLWFVLVGLPFGPDVYQFFGYR